MFACQLSIAFIPLSISLMIREKKNERQENFNT